MNNGTGAAVTFRAFNQEFNRVIKEMKAESSNLRQEFNLQQEQLKLNGTETDKLQSKLDYLRQAQEITGQKVAATREQLEKAKLVYGENSKEVDKLSRDLLAARTAEQRLANEIAQTNDHLAEQSDVASRASNSLNKTGEKLKNIGNVATTTVTPAIAAVGVGALKVATDFDSAQARMQAQLGITGEEAEKLRDFAKSVWEKGFGENIGEVTNHLVTVKQNIQGISDEALPKVTEQALILEKTFNVDVVESTRTATVMMKNFGIDASTAMDLMTVGFQKGGNFSDELLDTLREYSPQFSSMGHSAEDMLNILISGAEAGAFNLDKVGDAVKEFNVRAKDGTKTTAEGFAAIGLDAVQMGEAIAEGGTKGEQAFQATLAALTAIEEPVKRNTAGVALFGTQWEDLESEVISSMANSKNHIEGFEGSTSRAGESLEQTFGMKLTSIFRKLQDTLLPIGEVLLDFANSVLPPIAVAAEKVATWFSNLSPIGQNLAIIFGLIAAAIGPFLTMLGFMVQGIGALLVPFGGLAGLAVKLAPVFNVIRTAMMALTGPIGIIIAVVTTLAIIIYKNWDEIKQYTVLIWNGMKDFLTILWDSIKQFFIDTWTSMKDNAIALWNTIVNLVMAIVTPFINSVKESFMSMKNGLYQIFEGLKEYFSSVWDLIKNIFLGAILLIVDLVTGDFEGLKEHTKIIFDNIKEALRGIWDGIKLIFSGALETIKGYISTAWSEVKYVTSTILEAVKLKIQEIWSSAKTITSDLVDGIKNKVKEKFEDLKTSVHEKMTAAKEKIQEIWIEAETFFKNIDLKQIGIDIIQGLINGIGSMASAVWDKVNEIANSIKSTIKDALDIHSPSRVTKWLGQMVGTGLADGMETSLGNITSISERLAEAAVPKINNTNGAVSNNNNGTGISKIEQHINIVSPTPLSPSETARQNRLALQQAAFQIRR
ncbi:phage tail tape measure protein [Cytobacillus spongiae]|uniref:phage tail tape measure protein n=1 Tax=Cytobacillus spongiae TaxID=2901381 RepID=UPI001F32DD5C|nr:phage tail tape measure protein [Cytobacillus spongiae]UII56715.1 phage tail tape measure protein [Cytobacillus spongiae]